MPDMMDALKELLRQRLGSSDYERVEKMLAGIAAGAQDTDPSQPTRYTPAEGASDRAIAMDSSDPVERVGAYLQAKALVERHVGPVLATDSAAGVFREGLASLGVNAAGVHSSALQPMFMLKIRNGTPAATTDSAASADFMQRFPALRRIRTSTF